MTTKTIEFNIPLNELKKEGGVYNYTSADGYIITTSYLRDVAPTCFKIYSIRIDHGSLTGHGHGVIGSKNKNVTVNFYKDLELRDMRKITLPTDNKITITIDEEKFEIIDLMINDKKFSKASEVYGYNQMKLLEQTGGRKSRNKNKSKKNSIKKKKNTRRHRNFR